MMKSVVIALITICFGISIAIPIKDHDIDELVLRVNELRRLNPYQGRIQEKFKQNNNNGMEGIHRGKRAIDLDRNPTLYGYYSGVLNNIDDKRNFLDMVSGSSSGGGDLDRHQLERILLLKDYSEPSELASAQQHQQQFLDEPMAKRNFDEIDRALIGGLKKRLFSYRIPRLLNNMNYENMNYGPFYDGMSAKRNFDEIDRAGFTTLKRNFDEIDRAGFVGLHKRNFLDSNRNPSSSSLLLGGGGGVGGTGAIAAAGLSMEKRA